MLDLWYSIGVKFNTGKRSDERVRSTLTQRRQDTQKMSSWQGFNSGSEAKIVLLAISMRRKSCGQSTLKVSSSPTWIYSHFGKKWARDSKHGKDIMVLSRLNVACVQTWVWKMLSFAFESQNRLIHSTISYCSYSWLHLSAVWIIETKSLGEVTQKVNYSSLWLYLQESTLVYLLLMRTILTLITGDGTNNLASAVKQAHISVGLLNGTSEDLQKIVESQSRGRKIKTVLD